MGALEIDSNVLFKSATDSDYQKSFNKDIQSRKPKYDPKKLITNSSARLKTFGSKLGRIPVPSSLVTTASRLGAVGFGIAALSSGIDSLRYYAVKKLLENPSWVPSASFRANEPELTQYADTVINNRKIYKIEQQKKDFDNEINGYIEHLGGIENISEDDIQNMTRSTLDGYPELSSAIGNKVKGYTPNGVAPTNSSNVPFTPPPQTPPPLYPVNSPKANISPSSSSPHSPADTLLSVLTKNNDKLVAAVRGVPYDPESSSPDSSLSNGHSPIVPFDPFASTQKGLKTKDGISSFYDENGILFHLGSDETVKQVLNEPDYSSKAYKDDVAKLLNSRLTPRPIVGYEHSLTPHSSDYLADVAKKQAEWDEKYGTPEQLTNIKNNNRISEDDIKNVFKQNNVVPSSAVHPLPSSDSPASIQNIVISKSSDDVEFDSVKFELMSKQLEQANFQTTPIQLDNIDTIPKASPQMLSAIKNAVVAQKNSDENTFDLDEDEYNDWFTLPDISSVFNYNYKSARTIEGVNS